MEEIQDETPFPYLPLAPDEIRLLTLYRDDFGTELKCSINHASLKAPQPYMALSYIWGDPTTRRPILLDGHLFPITMNAAAFLQQVLADYDFYSHLLDNESGAVQHCTFWIDAVCINQADMAEKSLQVPLMKQIYEGASHVLVWLGSPDADSEAAFDGMMWLRRYADDTKHELGNNSSDRDVIQYVKNVGYLARSSSSKDGPLGMQPWRAMDRFFRRSWWSRVWIIQESTTMAPTQFICGGRRLSWETLELVIQIYGVLQSFPWNTSLSRIDGLMAPMRLFFFRFERQYGRCKMQLLKVLDFIRNHKATNPRDKVYAALGLAVDYTAGDMPIDYRLPTAVVYTQLAEYMTRTHQNLDVLGLVGSPGGDVPDLPSWVPDWNCNYRPKPFYKHLGCGCGCECGPPRPLYNASGVFSRDDFAIAEGGKLICRGLLIDRIKSLEPPGIESNTNVAVQESWIPSEQQKIYEQTNETMLHAYFRTLLADAIVQPGEQACRAINRSWPSEFQSGDNLLKIMRETTELKDGNPIFDATCRRRFMVTERGYIGLAPPDAIVGDQIWVLRGGKVLYLLRFPLNNQIGEKDYAFVGECYLHGFMDGEAVREGMCVVVLK